MERGGGACAGHGNGDSCGSSAYNGAEANGAAGAYAMTIAGIPLNSPPEVYKNQIHSGGIAT